jgi:hypothetical protein
MENKLTLLAACPTMWFEHGKESGRRNLFPELLVIIVKFYNINFFAIDK